MAIAAIFLMLLAIVYVALYLYIFGYEVDDHIDELEARRRAIMGRNDGPHKNR